MTTANGAGDNKIELFDAGRVIFENWKGGGGDSGHSRNGVPTMTFEPRPDGTAQSGTTWTGKTGRSR